MSNPYEPQQGQQTPPSFQQPQGYSSQVPSQPQQGYPPQMHYQQQPPKKGRSKLLIGCGALVAIFLCIGVIAIAAIMNGGGDATPTAVANAPAGTSVSARPPTAVASVPSGSSAGTSSSAAASTPAGASSSTRPSAAASSSGAASKPPATVAIFKKGDTATVEGQKVTLNEVSKKGAIFVADLTVENTGTKEINVSSLVSFDARDVLGNQGSFAFAETKGLDGKVAVGSKIRGTVGYAFAADVTGVKLYYDANLFTGQPVAFALDDAAAAQPFPPHPIASEAKPLDKNVTYKVGDTVKVGDLVLKLANVSVQGTIFMADLVAYNAGGKAVNLSSLLSFSGRDSAGKQGDFKLSEKAGFDGTLLPGDSLQGQISLEFDAGSTGHVLTYTSSLFGGQSVKWALD